MAIHIDRPFDNPFVTIPGKYGKKEFLKIQIRLHEKYDFQKMQEILGQDYKEAVHVLEEI